MAGISVFRLLKALKVLGEVTLVTELWFGWLILLTEREVFSH